MKNLIIILSFVILSSCDNKKEQKTNLDHQELINNANVIKTLGFLSVNNLTVDLGDISHKNMIKHKFNLKNEGTENVEVLGYEKSCKCTDLKVDKYIIEPNDEVVIEMHIDTIDKELGNHKITSTIKTNGKRKFYLLTVNFNII